MQKWKRQHLTDGRADYTEPMWKGIFYIIDMLIPLGRDPMGKERYTCKHLSSDGKQCMAYETRPRMCREFGVKGNVCVFGSVCTWKSGVHGPDEFTYFEEEMNQRGAD